MIKRVTVYSLREGTDPDELWKYHTEVHASDYKKVCGSRLKKYVINRVTKVSSGKAEFWGLAETWWESEEEMNAATEEHKNIKLANGKTMFEDFTSRVNLHFIAWVEEKEIKI